MTVPERSVMYHWARQDDPLEWMDFAACIGFPVEVFFPDKGESYREARALCARCQVLDRCRDAIDRMERDLSVSAIQGLYAGETPGERRRRRKPSSGPAAIHDFPASGDAVSARPEASRISRVRPGRNTKAPAVSDRRSLRG